MQVFGNYPSGNKNNLKDTLYRFKLVQGSRFRLKNVYHSTYTWSLYSVGHEDGVEEFEDAVSF